VVGTKSCEQTSADALGSWIQEIWSQLDHNTVNGVLSPIIGGRFDVVAHSMGGLAARHYATFTASQFYKTWNYESSRNRNQGDFSTVITIDTPHLGSELATYVVDHASWPVNWYVQQWFESPPGPPISPELIGDVAVWKLAQCSISDTFESCLKIQGNPVTCPDGADNCGAVASLEPNYSQQTTQDCGFLAGWPMGLDSSPNTIENAATAMIAATFDDQTATQPSALRAALGTMAHVIEGVTDNSLSKILGNVPDDVIVPLSSESYPLPPGGLGPPFEYTEHSALIPQAAPWLAQALPNAVGYSDMNVMHSSSVNKAVLCLLLAAGSSPACGGPAMQNNAILRIAPDSAMIKLQSPDTRPGHIVTDRIRAEDPAEKPRLGETIQIPLTIFVSGIQKLWTTQYYFDNELQDPTSHLVPKLVPESILELPIEHSADGRAFITLRLLRAGQLKITISGRYPDGNVANLSKNLDVGLPQALPTGIIVGRFGLVGSNFAVLTERLNASGVEPLSKWPLGAKYESVKQIVPIDPKMATYRFRTINHRPVIAFNRETGNYKLLEPGEEIVETTFGGWTNLTCVEVLENDDHDRGGGRPLPIVTIAWGKPCQGKAF